LPGARRPQPPLSVCRGRCLDTAAPMQSCKPFPQRTPSRECSAGSVKERLGNKTARSHSAPAGPSRGPGLAAPLAVNLRSAGSVVLPVGNKSEVSMRGFCSGGSAPRMVPARTVSPHLGQQPSLTAQCLRALSNPHRASCSPGPHIVSASSKAPSSLSSSMGPASLCSSTAAPSSPQRRGRAPIPMPRELVAASVQLGTGVSVVGTGPEHGQSQSISKAGSAFNFMEKLVDARRAPSPAEGQAYPLAKAPPIACGSRLRGSSPAPAVMRNAPRGGHVWVGVGARGVEQRLPIPCATSVNFHPYIQAVPQTAVGGTGRMLTPRRA